MKDFFKGVRKHIDKLDATHLREQYKLVADEYARTDMLIHALKEGIVRLDANGEAVQHNPAARQLLGADPADAIRSLGIRVESVANASESGEIARLMEARRVNYIVYTGAVKDATVGDYTALHRRAMQLSIPCLTSLDTAGALADMMASRLTAGNTELISELLLSDTLFVHEMFEIF